MERCAKADLCIIYHPLQSIPLHETAATRPVAVTACRGVQPMPRESAPRLPADSNGPSRRRYVSKGRRSLPHRVLA